jgi:VWFA-related protein
MRSALLALLLLAAASVPAQVNESLTVQYVEVPVTVVDRGGNPIRGLTKANFEVLDEGKKREIAGFEAVDFKSVQSPGVVAPIPAPARRNFLLLFDLTYSSPPAMKRAKEAGRKFIADMVGPQDRVAVGTVDVAHGLRLLTSFTTDRPMLISAIAKPSGFTALDPLQLAGTAIDPDVAAWMTGKGGGGLGDDDNPNIDIVREQNRMTDSYNRGKIDTQLEMLTDLSNVLRAVRGEKHLVLLSEGFDSRLIQGNDAGGTTTRNLITVQSGSDPATTDNDNRFGSARSLGLLRHMAEMAKRSDVVFDVVDIHGLRTDQDARNGYQHNSNEGLHLLASATGGTMFQNSNDIAEDFQRVLREQEVVYVLAFQAPASKPGTFHDIRVKLLDVPGGRAIARSGYFEAGGGGTEAERTLSNAEIMVNDIAQDAVHVAPLVAAFPTSGANAQVPVVLEINGEDVTKAAVANQATLEIFTYAFDERGVVRDSMFHRVNLDLAKAGSALRETGVKYYATLSLPAGKYAVKNLVRVAESDKKGFSRTDVVVPEQRAFTVSQPFCMDRDSRWIMIRGGSHDKTNAPYPFAVKGESFVPGAVTQRSGGTRRCVVFVNNAVPDELTVTSSSAATPVAQISTPIGATLVYDVTGDASKLDIFAERHQ